MINEKNNKRVLVEINNGYFSYDDSYGWSIKIPCFTSRSGEIVAVVGESASGKTTLLELLLGQVKLKSGHIRYSRDIYNVERAIGYVSQDNTLIPWLSVINNITWAINKNKSHNLKNIISILGLSGYEKKYPDELSGGLKRRVMFARALAQNPELLLLDEPFSGLDIPSRNDLVDMMINVVNASKVGIIWVTHDIDDLALAANKIYVVSKNGKISSDPIINSMVLGSKGRGSEKSRRLSEDVLESF